MQAASTNTNAAARAIAKASSGMRQELTASVQSHSCTLTHGLVSHAWSAISDIFMEPCRHISRLIKTPAVGTRGMLGLLLTCVSMLRLLPKHSTVKFRRNGGIWHVSPQKTASAHAIHALPLPPPLCLPDALQNDVLLPDSLKHLSIYGPLI